MSRSSRTLMLVLWPAALAALLLAGVLAPGCSTQNPLRTITGSQEPREFRGIWVTRWDYRSAADVEKAIDEVAAAGFTDVFWQVRGQADAFYRSSLEPWGADLFRDRPGITDPGFDPLAVAVARAKQRDVRLHAWINVYPLWKGEEPPTDPRHVYIRKPEWRLYDELGRPQPLNEHYVVGNPTHPELQGHIAAVCRDIVRRYSVDGLHLDYVRFVGDTLEEGRVYPADAGTIARFSAATGRRSLATPEDRAAHAAWIRDEITGLVERIRRESKQVRPTVELSAAVWRTPEAAREKQLQDAPKWLADGTVDRVLPMIYTESNGEYSRDLALWLGTANGKPVSPGIGSYKHKPTQTLEQIRLSSGAEGYCLFAFATFFEGANPWEPRDESAVAARSAMRRAIEPVQLGTRSTRAATE